MIYHNVSQKSDEWVRLRLGVPTASCFDKLLTPAKLDRSKSQDSYIDCLIGEKLSLYGPERPESYMSRSMRHGEDTEEEARRFYAMERNVQVENGGFCLADDSRYGASPDGLIGLIQSDSSDSIISTEGGLELKCPQYDTQVRYLRGKKLPDEYRLQVHGGLIVTGARWWDFLSYHPGLPPFLVRVEPDEVTEILRKELDAFCGRYKEALAFIKSLQP